MTKIEKTMMIKRAVIERDARIAALESMALELAGALSRVSMVLAGEEMNKGALIRSLECARTCLSSTMLAELRAKADQQ